ncbi:MAG: hypothetical protein EZS28_010882 [Streblomastix strix]|uniref:Protein kinase domain-containing protein n=1 Tax=Streblomastix strix TaxID=222440 RepID=A0A5J4WFC8_9EUKA|nr:MAG: hypothetical protein EZS28_010882 [Streblomastix strix]
MLKLQQEQDNEKQKEKGDKLKILDVEKDWEKFIQKQPKQTKAIDVWGIGIILSELLAKRHPFYDEKEKGKISSEELVRRITQVEPVELPQKYPEIMRNLIKRMLIKVFSIGEYISLDLQKDRALPYEQIEEEGGNEEIEAQITNNGQYGYVNKVAKYTKGQILNIFIDWSYKQIW